MGKDLIVCSEKESMYIHLTQQQLQIENINIDMYLLFIHRTGFVSKLLKQMAKAWNAEIG